MGLLGSEGEMPEVSSSRLPALTDTAMVNLSIHATGGGCMLCLVQSALRASHEVIGWTHHTTFAPLTAVGG